MKSIRSRLLAWLLSSLLLAGLLASAVTYFQAREDVNGVFDFQLQRIAASMKNHRLPQPVDLRDTGSLDGEGDEEGDWVVQIWRNDGTLMYGSRPDLLLPRYPERGLSTRSWKEKDWRVYATTWRDRTIQVAQPLDVRREMAAAVAFRVLIPVLVLIPLLGVVIRISVGRALRPLDEIGASLETRGAAAMAPLPERDLPGEVIPLVKALNNLLRRLGESMEVQRRFVADAAHELRTPLTAVQLQLQLVERATSAEEREAELVQLERGVQRASHLVRQLLTMARVEPDAVREPPEPVALEETVHTVIAEYAPIAADKNVDLGLARSEPATVAGYPADLRIMLSNLVDNAIRFTPSDGRIDLRLSLRGKDAVLEVEDTGTGIPPEDRDRVFDRFYRRHGGDTRGSGLGLAIVKSIVDRHGGRITLDAGDGGRGLKVTVTLDSIP
ncbi:MAG: sensor histidine kinase [Desulfobacteria bacterium]